MIHSCQKEMEIFEKLRKKWKILLTGGETLDTAAPQVQNYIKSIEKLAGEQWNALIKLNGAEEDTRIGLFEDLPLTDKSTRTGSSQITLTFDRLKAIVLGYETNGSVFYKNETMKRELIAALDLMVKDHYSLYYAGTGINTGNDAEHRAFGNWYDWRIGTPRQFCDLLLMFYDELEPERLAAYIEPIMANNKRVDTTGANRTWIANIFIQCGILLGDKDLVEAGRNGIADVFKFVETRDGFYRDGSFVQHYNYAYTGGYGKALLCTLAPMMYVLNQTPYAIEYEDGRQKMFYDMLFEAYEPLIYGGRFMDMAREREISRVANQDHIPGRQAIRSIIMISEVLPDDLKVRAKAMVKEWLSDEEVFNQVCIDPTGPNTFNEYYLPAEVMNMAFAIMASDIAPRGTLVCHKRYASMDRVVHLRDTFGFTVSMCSDRIKNTEGTNDEGLRLWNIGDGLTYLYNSDKSYYSDHYWATVDYQRLPGITTNRVPEREPKEGYGTFNPYSFAGGTNLREFGIAGMEVQGIGDCGRNGAHAKKSWFMFDDEIVAMGSDISSSLEESPVETIVENRKLSPDMWQQLLVNGVAQENENQNFCGVHKKTEWIHLSGVTEDSNVGYYFPGSADITGVCETRQGQWMLVNTYAKFIDKENRTNRFVTFWFDHGVMPAGATYSYVLLPGKSAEETAAYNENPDIEILRLDETIHAVREKTLNITGIHFFEAGTYGAFRTEMALSVMFKENKEEGTVEISFADPTQKAQEVRLETSLPILEVMEKDEAPAVSEENGMTVFTASCAEIPSGNAGRSFHIKVKTA